MRMFELLITLCISGDPAMCSEKRVPFMQPMNMMRCMRHGLNHAQIYADARPDMELKRWRCVEEESAAVEDSERDFSVKEVADGVFVHRGFVDTPTPENQGDLANIGFIIGDEAVAVIDAGGTAKVAEGLLAAIRAQTDKPVRYLLLTHMHPDHVLGANVFDAVGATIIGHANLKDALLARAETYTDNIRRLVGDEAFEGTEVVFPDESVSGAREIDLGGRVLRLEAHETAHTSTDMTVYDVETDTWFLGDLLFSEHTPALDGSIVGWLKLMETLSAREVVRVVPGHGPEAMSWPDAAAPMLTYLGKIAEETRAAVKEGRTLGDTVRSAGESERENWELFDEFNPRNVTAAYTELEWE